MGALLLGVLGHNHGCRAHCPKRPLPPGQSRPADEGQLDGRIAKYAAELEHQNLAGVLYVEQGGHPRAHIAFGVADRRCAQVNTLASVFDIGSIAKTFTAAAVLTLVDDGRVRLTDPLSRWFDHAPPDKAAITVHQLLTHSSGLDNYHAPGDFTPMRRSTAVRRALSLAVRHPPGERGAYSNAGYALLAAIVEEASGRPFTAFVEERLLQPLQLRHTGWFGGRLATVRGYVNGRGRGRPQDARLTWALLGGGGMVSNARDLARWTRALRNGRVLSEASTAAMFDAAVDGWSAGWSLSSGPHGTVVIKGGSSEQGFTSQIRHYPRSSTTIVVLLNATVPPHGPNIHNVVGVRMESLVFR